MNITKIASNFAQNITQYAKKGADIASMIKNGTDKFISQKNVGDFKNAHLLDSISRYANGYEGALNARSNAENFYRFIKAVSKCNGIAYLKGVLDGAIKKFLKN